MVRPAPAAARPILSSWTPSWPCLAVVLAAALLTLLPAGAAAQQGGNPASVIDQAINEVWVVWCATLVLFMQAGFAMLEVGAAPAKNAGAVMGKILINLSISWLMFWIIGWYIAFTPGHDLFGYWNSKWNPGMYTGLVMNGGDSALAYSNTPVQAQFYFQTVFCSVSLAIVWGTMLDRTKFLAYIIFAFVFCGFIYPVGAHWTWGAGWLSKRGYIDFAGSSIVHLQGAVAAMAGTLLLGPRLGKFAKGKAPQKFDGHSLPYQVLGTIILWVGWMGFNPGSFLNAVNANIADVAVNTNLAGAAGVLGAMVAALVMRRTYDVVQMSNGAIAGLVAITSPCAFVDGWAAVVIGIVAGLIVPPGEWMFERMYIDDPINCLTCHGLAGIWGTLSAGVFATPDRVTSLAVGVAGSVYSGRTDQLAVQAVGVAATIAWAFGSSLIIFGLIRLTVGLRVSKEVELEGLDLHEHGAHGLPERFVRVAGADGEQTMVPLGGSGSGRDDYLAAVRANVASGSAPGGSTRGSESKDGLVRGGSSILAGLQGAGSDSAPLGEAGDKKDDGKDEAKVAKGADAPTEQSPKKRGFSLFCGLGLRSRAATAKVAAAAAAEEAPPPLPLPPAPHADAVVPMEPESNSHTDDAEDKAGEPPKRDSPKSRVPRLEMGLEDVEAPPVAGNMYSDATKVGGPPPRSGRKAASTPLAVSGEDSEVPRADSAHDELLDGTPARSPPASARSPAASPPRSPVAPPKRGAWGDVDAAPVAPEPEPEVAMVAVPPRAPPPKGGRGRGRK